MQVTNGCNPIQRSIPSRQASDHQPATTECIHPSGSASHLAFRLLTRKFEGQAPSKEKHRRLCFGPKQAHLSSINNCGMSLSQQLDECIQPPRHELSDETTFAGASEERANNESTFELDEVSLEAFKLQTFDWKSQAHALRRDCIALCPAR
jgi:hypothetical protein